MWGGGQTGWSTSAPAAPASQQSTPAAMNWSLDPNHYSQIPHNQVDWASLAQQWIQMKGTDVVSHSQQQQHLQNPQVQQEKQPDINASTTQQHQDVIGEYPMDLDESAGHEPMSSTPLYTRSSSSMPSGGRGGNMHSLPLVRNSTIHDQDGLEKHTESTLQAWTRPPYQDSIHTVPPNLSMQPHYIPDSSGSYAHPSNWPQSHPHFDVSGLNSRVKQYHTPKDIHRKLSYHEEDTQDEELEAARRRALPSWIREGLEKVEREKRKAEEREQAAAAREEERRLRRIRDHQPTNLGDSLQAQHSTRIKEEFQEPLTLKLLGSVRQHPLPPLTLEAILASLSKEEQIEQVMLSVRRQLTRILLEVTNDEMHVVAQEALERARAKQKGLGDYGTDSEDSASEEDEGPIEEVDSEAELISEIQRKKRNFEMSLIQEEDEYGEDGAQKRGITSQSKKHRSRSKSGDKAGTNGKITVSQISSETGKGRGEDVSKDGKEYVSHRRRQNDKQRNSRSSSRTYRPSRKGKRSKSKSQERRRHRSRSAKQNRRQRSRSSSSSSSKRSTKEKRKSRSPSNSKKGRHRSRSTSRRRRNRSKEQARSSSKDRRRKSRRSASSSSSHSSPRSNSPRRHQQRH